MADDDRQPSDMDERIREGDKPMIEAIGLSSNEWHALKLGVAGLFIGFAYASGFEEVAVLTSMSMVGYAVAGKPFGRAQKGCDDAEDKRIAIETMKHEPWYFLASYVVWFVVGLQAVGFV